MAENSKIEWTDHTFNPWIGCTKVSPACDHCYAETSTPARVLRGTGNETWGPHSVRRRTSPATWRKPHQWNKKSFELQQAGRMPLRVFCASLADVFDNHKSIDPQWRTDLFTLIEETSFLTWQLLTKRPQNIMKMVPESWRAGLPRNVWIGTTVENQEEANRRIPALLKVPAAIHFLSCEPLLGEVSVAGMAIGGTLWIGGQRGCGGTHNHAGRAGVVYHRYYHEVDPRAPHHHHDERCKKGLDWVICGGESGANARPMNPEWARSLRDQCARAGVPFFFKQWGEWVDYANSGACQWTIHKRENGVMFGSLKNDAGSMFNGDKFETRYPWKQSLANPCMVKLGKKRAGRLLDCAEHDAIPSGGQ
jgi:protein gp37